MVAAQSGVQPTYPQELTNHLLALMCKARYADGSVAWGIARRAQQAGFRGDIARIYGRLSGPDCPGSKGIDGTVLQRLSTAMDMAKSQ